MEAYIDLSYVFHLLLCITTNKFTKIISNISLNRKKLIILEITSILIYINVLVYTSISIYLNTLFLMLLFLIFYKKRFIKPLFIFIFSYYSQISVIRVFTNSIYLYKSIIMIYDPVAFLYILICPLLLIIVEIITRSVNALILLRKYRYNVKLIIENKTYETEAYFDSGNTLKFKDLPVVFLTNELKDKNVSYERILIEGIGKQTSEYLKGKIWFEDKEKDVYFAYVKKRSFNGCKCLLNVYLLG